MSLLPCCSRLHASLPINLPSWDTPRRTVDDILSTPPLSSETHFFEFERRDGYMFSNLGVLPSGAFSTDIDFVNHIEHKDE